MLRSVSAPSQRPHLGLALSNEPRLYLPAPVYPTTQFGRGGNQVPLVDLESLLVFTDAVVVSTSCRVVTIYCGVNVANSLPLGSFQVLNGLLEFAEHLPLPRLQLLWLASEAGCRNPSCHGQPPGVERRGSLHSLLCVSSGETDASQPKVAMNRPD